MNYTLKENNSYLPPYVAALFSVSAAAAATMFSVFFHFRGSLEASHVFSYLFALPLSALTVLCLTRRRGCERLFFFFVFTSLGAFRLWCEPAYLPDLFFFPVAVAGCLILLPRRHAYVLCAYGLLAIGIGAWAQARFAPVSTLFIARDSVPVFGVVFAATTVLLAVIFAVLYSRSRSLTVSLRDRTEELTDLSDDYLSLVTVLTHDFANHAMVASLAAGALRVRLPHPGQETTRSLEMIDRAVGEIQQTIGKLRELRAVCGLPVPEAPAGRARLDHVLDRSRFVFLEKLAKNRLELATEVDLPKGLLLLADPAILSTHIFNNLVDNAIKFSPPNSTIRISALLAAGRVRIKIENEVAEELPLERSGMGLGLRIAERFCRKQNISLSSGPAEDSGRKRYVSVIEIDAEPGNPDEPEFHPNESTSTVLSR